MEIHRDKRKKKEEYSVNEGVEEEGTKRRRKNRVKAGEFRKVGGREERGCGGV